MKNKNRTEAIKKAIISVASDTIIPRKDEELFGILFAEHLIMNGGPEVDPELLILSMRDAFYELNHLKEHNPNANVENVFTNQYINKLIKKGWHKRKAIK